jgi:hypothetical protein
MNGPSPEIDVRREETTEVSVDAADAGETMDPSFIRDDSMDVFLPLPETPPTIGVNPAVLEANDPILVGLVGGTMELSIETPLIELAPEDTVSSDRRLLPTRFRGSGRGGLAESTELSPFLAESVT